MRSRKLLVGLACLAASTALFAKTAHADRRSGLAGNLLIQDPDDLFPFPQYTLKHRNMIRLDYGATIDMDENRGNGVITLGNKNSAYGLAMHRGDLLNPDVVGFNTELSWLGGVGNPFGATSQSAFPGPGLTLPPGGVPATTTTLPATVVDLFYGRAVGDNTWGLRLGYGRGVQALKTDDEVTKGASQFIAGQFGYSILPPQGLRLDLSANLLTAIGKTALPGEDWPKGFDLRVGGLARGYYPLNNYVDFAFLGQFSVDNERTKDYSGVNVKSNDFSGTVMAGVGPAIHTERAQIAAYGGFLMGAGKNVPDTEDSSQNVNRLNFLAPMVNMAAEVQLLDWLFVRTGAQYIWQMDRYGGTDAAGTRKERVSSAPFNWSVGLGVMKNNFYFDGVIRNGFVTSGPSFIGGNANGFLAMASMTYKFGDVFDGASFKNGRTNASRPPERPVNAPVVVAPPAPAAAVESTTESASEPAAVDGEASGTSGDSVSAQGSASGTTP